MVANWLKITYVILEVFQKTNLLRLTAFHSHYRYEKDILLSGLIYCHRISNTEMAATSVRHLRTFEELCGKDALHNVILVTTMWDEVDETTGKLEEEKMKKIYWNKMLERKSTTGRFMGTRESALKLLQPLIDAANKRSSLLLQHEMVDMGKKLTETSAGRHLFTRAQHIVSQRQEVIQRIQTEMRRAFQDRAPLQPLHDEHMKLTQNSQSAVEEIQALDPPGGRRFLMTSEKWIAQKLLVLKLMLTGTIKVEDGEFVDGVKGTGEASPTSCSKESLNFKKPSQAEKLGDDQNEAISHAPFQGPAAGASEHHHAEATRRG